MAQAAVAQLAEQRQISVPPIPATKVSSAVRVRVTSVERFGEACEFDPRLYARAIAQTNVRGPLVLAGENSGMVQSRVTSSVTRCGLSGRFLAQFSSRKEGCLAPIESGLRFAPGWPVRESPASQEFSSRGVAPRAPIGRGGGTGLLRLWSGTS